MVGVVVEHVESFVHPSGIQEVEKVLHSFVDRFRAGVRTCRQYFCDIVGFGEMLGQTRMGFSSFVQSVDPSKHILFFII